MRKALLDGVVALLYGLAAWFAWWFVYMLGFGAVGNEAVAVFLIGIPISAFAGLGLGAMRGPDANIPAICVGWTLSLVATPATMILMNPANTTASDRLGPILILASVLVVGAVGAITGVRYSRDKNRRRLMPLAMATIVITGLLALVLVIWK